MNNKVRTCLWFEKNGLAAARFYVSLLDNSRLEISIGNDEDEPLLIPFILGGTPYQILNGGPHYRLSEAASISVATTSQKETDRLWFALTANGGEENHCGWLKDRWGVSWQIVPVALTQMLSSEDRAAAQRVEDLMLTMFKFDIEALKRAFYNE